MLSYIYMKILESRPARYDRGVRWLSLGRSDRTRQRIVDECVNAGDRLLDIGAGTGTLALLAARKGAHVVGFDVSPGMLEVARNKVACEGLTNRVRLEEMGIARMDRFDPGTFDVVTSTLVFSELSSDEQNYALRQGYRLLRPGGVLVVADETRPRGLLRRLAYNLVRLPLLIVTFLLTQTTTRAVAGLDKRIAEAGFRVECANQSALGTFICVVARKRLEPPVKTD